MICFVLNRKKRIMKATKITPHKMKTEDGQEFEYAGAF